jgi:hypothetical protein
MTELEAELLAALKLGVVALEANKNWLTTDPITVNEMERAFESAARAVIARAEPPESNQQRTDET